MNAIDRRIAEIVKDASRMPSVSAEAARWLAQTCIDAREEVQRLQRELGRSENP